MKRFLYSFLLLSLCSIVAKAQDYSFDNQTNSQSEQIITKRNGKIYKYGVMNDPETVFDEDLYKDWKSKSLMENIGGTCIGFGIGYTLGVYISSNIYKHLDRDDVNRQAVIGLSIAAVGLPFAIIGSIGTKKAVKEQNNRLNSGLSNTSSNNDLSLAFGVNEYGLSLSLHF